MVDLNLQGMIADIQHFSLHDGPGIRSTVFMKGCNMHCSWCHNPETISSKPEKLYYLDKCIHCGYCNEECFTGAQVTCGRLMTVPEIIQDIREDLPYYGQEGGLTVSGGEPLIQPEFTQRLLQNCQELGIHTAIETNLAVSTQRVEEVTAYADLVMADLKIWDDKQHREWTGLGNQLIKTNLRKLNTPLILRTPLIPSVNMQAENIRQTAAFAASLNHLLYYELLPYHALGMSKQSAVADDNKTRQFEQPDSNQVNELAELAIEYGIPVRIHGRAVQA